MARPTKNLRLFVAAYPPIDVARAMIDTLQRVDLPPASRLTPVEQAHLTLQFVGDVPAADLDDAIESVHRAAAGLDAFTLNLRRLIALPERGPKRLIAMETDAPKTLLELHRRLAVRLASKVREQPGRGLRPHITVCRFANPVKHFQMNDASALAAGSFDVGEIALMRSTLTNAGATHHAVARVALGQ